MEGYNLLLQHLFNCEEWGGASQNSKKMTHVFLSSMRGPNIHVVLSHEILSGILSTSTNSVVLILGCFSQ